MILEWWHWMILGLCLVMTELAVPAFFIVWFGIGAVGVAIVLLLSPDLQSTLRGLIQKLPRT